MKQIAYLFGAGASCESMPLNNQISSRLSDMINKIAKVEYGIRDDSFLIKEDLIKDLNWLHHESMNHASIDTFAKKLYIKGDWKNLKRLRLAFSVFFTCEQLNKLPDKRYDAFFASIIDSRISELPDHVKLITWNYDFQLELAFMEFSDAKFIVDAQSQLNLTIKGKKRYHIPPRNYFEIFKLNGDISVRNFPPILHNSFISSFKKELNEETLKEIVDNWKFQLDKGDDSCSNLSFAWEVGSQDMLDYIGNRTANTEILIVIGYSFPFFNREIDRQLISSMKNLTKVYIQSPDANDLEERFQSIDERKSIQIVKRFDKHQFLIPSEL